MTRLVGFDINGWRDLAVRNWIQRPGEDNAIGEDSIISGGIDGSVIRLNVSDRNYVGGAQAMLAPHGRGAGWGLVGERGARTRVRELIASPIGAEDQIAACLVGLAQGADVGVLAISDAGTVGEEAQEALLEAMRRAGVRRRLLVWRPVLALLGEMVKQDFREGERIGIVSHEGQGFVTQVLTLRQGRVLAPERREAGKAHLSHLGLERLCAGVLAQLSASYHQRAGDDFLVSTSIPVRTVLGEPAETEILRRRNGTWLVIEPPSISPGEDLAILDEVARALRGCDKVLFETPARGPLAKMLAEELCRRMDADVLALPPQTVARGARVAAGRLHDGEPVYFDFLPQISTIVSGDEGARNFDLIPPGELLPAGSLYRSRHPAEFVVLPGQEQISVYIRKENVSRPRLARLTWEQTVDRTTPVTLSVEQRPVSGRARLILSSRAFTTPRVVDFDAATPQDKSWEEIIANLQRPPPEIPRRMVLPCGLNVWNGVANRRGLSQMLAQNLDSDTPSWRELAQIMTARPEGRYALDSDGHPPEGLPPHDLAAFDRMLRRAEEEVLNRIAAGENPDNDPLRFATWAFRRCPQGLVPAMLEALGSAVKDHPLLLTGASRALIYQGLGRVLQDAGDMRRVMDHLFAFAPEEWNKNQVACMGFLLSRTDEAPRLLDRNEVEFLAKVVAHGLEREAGGNYGPTFIYLPFLLVGLLRWRMVERYALVSNRDPAADAMGTALERVITSAQSIPHRSLRLQRYYELLCKSREVLAGAGEHPDILVEIFNLQST